MHLYRGTHCSDCNLVQLLNDSVSAGMHWHDAKAVVALSLWDCAVPLNRH